MPSTTTGIFSLLISRVNRFSPASNDGRNALARGTTNASYSSLIRPAAAASVRILFETTSVPGVSRILWEASLKIRLPELVAMTSWSRASSTGKTSKGLFPERRRMRFARRTSVGCTEFKLGLPAL